MTYFLVMGSLALSVMFTLGWALTRVMRWLASGLSLGSGGSAGRKSVRRSTTARKAPVAKNGAAKAGSAAGRSKAAAKARSEPWRLTRKLAEWRSSTALALVAALIYLVARLAEHGMSFRPPHGVPAGFHGLLTALGWLSASLILLALLHRLAVWRCRR